MSVSSASQPDQEIVLNLGDVIVGYDEDFVEIELKVVAQVTDPSTQTEYLVVHDELNDRYALSERCGWLVVDEDLARQMIESVLTLALAEEV